MRLFFAERIIIVALLLLPSCGEPNDINGGSGNCNVSQAIKCSLLDRVASPSRDYEALTKIHSYGGGFGTGYDSADVYRRRTGTSNADTLLFSIEDNADDLIAKNFTISWASPNQLVIRYGHGNITFQVVKFAGKTITAVHDATLDQVVRQ